LSKLSRVESYIKSHLDILISLLVSIVVVSLILLSVNPVIIYKKLSLDTVFLTVYGVLLGLLITAYSIILSTIPSMPKELLETDAYKRINSVFFYSIIINVGFVLISILALFLSGLEIIYWIALTQIIVSVFLTSIIFLIVIYLRELFLAFRYNTIRK
jgi:MFS family permease